MQKKRLIYVVSGVDKSLGLEWAANELKDLFDLTFILLNPSRSAIEETLETLKVFCIRIAYRGKNDAPITWLRLCVLFMKLRPEMVHTHLFDATLLGLSAAWITGVKKRIYTRHNSTFHHVYHPRAVRYDLWSNYLATHIISLSQATDYALLQMENVPAGKIRKIPHGIQLEEFRHPAPERVERIRVRWNIKTGRPVIGVIARHIEWKGIQYIIPAFAGFVNKYPEALLILANASGPYQPQLMKMLHALPKESYQLIPFEEDVAALYKVFSFYVHTPVDRTCEAFGQTYVEALAAGVPSIFTLSGIAAEFVEHGRHAWVVPYRNSDAILQGMLRVFNDSNLKDRMASNGIEAVSSRFELSTMMAGLHQVYNE